MSKLKKSVSNAILLGAVGALIAFAVSIFLPKMWLVSGKIVVFPSGKPVSASQNLSAEVGNTAWIVNSDAFQKNNFGELVSNFTGANVVNNSSMVLVKFQTTEANLQATEDLIVKIPGQVDEYARDLYGGSPFKYKLTSDPEVSTKPVRPDVMKISEWGFAIGVIIYFLYWLMLEDYIFRSAENEVISEPQKRKSVFNFLPEMKDEIKVFGEKTPTHQLAEKEPEVAPHNLEMPKADEEHPLLHGEAPINLPVAEPEVTPLSETNHYSEPTDEQVKDRLNKLMRGEL